MLQKLATPAAAALPAASSLKQRPTVANIQAVQLAIERCLSVYMSQAQVVDLLHTYARVEPAFTTLVWNKLAENNPAFFEAYELQVRLKDQVLLFNHLLEQQRAVMAMLHHAWQQSAAAACPGQVVSEGIHGPGAATVTLTTKQWPGCAGGEQTPLNAPVVPSSASASAGAAGGGGGGAAAGAAAAVHHHQGHTLPAAGTGGGRGGAVGVVAGPSAAHTPLQSRPPEPWPPTPQAAAGVSGGQAGGAASPAAWNQRQLPSGQQQQGAVQQFQQLQELAHQQQQSWAQPRQQQQQQQQQGRAPHDQQGLPQQQRQQQQQQQQDWAQQQQQGWAPHDPPQQQQQGLWEQRWSSSGAPCSMEQSAGNGCAGLGGGAPPSQQVKGAGSVIHSPAISSVQGSRDRTVSGSGSGGTYSPTPAAAAAGAAGAGRSMTGPSTLEEMLAPAADVDVGLDQQGLLDLPPSADDVLCMLEEWQ